MRTFIAIDIPYTPPIRNLQNDINGRAKLVEKENLHITLKFLGEIDQDTLKKIKNIVENCKSKKFNIKLKGVGFFPNERYIKIIWIGIENYNPIVDMAKCIDEKLSKLGFKKEKSYVPHLTIARAKGKITIRNLENYKNMIFEEVEVKNIKIKKSTLTPEGPIYEDLAVIQL